MLPFQCLVGNVTKCYGIIVTFCYNKVKGCEKNMELIGLKEMRKRKKYSQLKVAMDLAISREALSYYETGKRSPDVEMLVKLSRYFNVSIDYLIFGENFGK